MGNFQHVCKCNVCGNLPCFFICVTSCEIFDKSHIPVECYARRKREIPEFEHLYSAPYEDGDEHEPD